MCVCSVHTSKTGRQEQPWLASPATAVSLCCWEVKHISLGTAPHQPNYLASGLNWFISMQDQSLDWANVWLSTCSCWGTACSLPAPCQAWSGRNNCLVQWIHYFCKSFFFFPPSIQPLKHCLNPHHHKPGQRSRERSIPGLYSFDVAPGIWSLHLQFVGSVRSYGASCSP